MILKGGGRRSRALPPTGGGCWVGGPDGTWWCHAAAPAGQELGWAPLQQPTERWDGKDAKKKAFEIQDIGYSFLSSAEGSSSLGPLGEGSFVPGQGWVPLFAIAGGICSAWGVQAAAGGGGSTLLWIFDGVALRGPVREIRAARKSNRNKKLPLYRAINFLKDRLFIKGEKATQSFLNIFNVLNNWAVNCPRKDWSSLMQPELTQCNVFLFFFFFQSLGFCLLSVLLLLALL